MSTKEQRERIELLQGTLDLLILRTLLLGPAHGHAIAKAIEFRSEDVLQVEQGSLYPALHRLIKRGWISVQDGTSENNRRAKFYRLTARGRRQLEVETSKWGKLAGAIARILRPPNRRANHEPRQVTQALLPVPVHWAQAGVPVPPVRPQAPPGKQVVGRWVVIRKSTLPPH